MITPDPTPTSYYTSTTASAMISLSNQTFPIPNRTGSKRYSTDLAKERSNVTSTSSTTTNVVKAREAGIVYLAEGPLISTKSSFAFTERSTSGVMTLRERAMRVPPTYCQTMGYLVLHRVCLTARCCCIGWSGGRLRS